MTYRQFQVSTNRTGIHRVIRVRLYDTMAHLREDYYRRWPTDDPAFPPVGTFIGRDTWANRDPRPVQGTIWLPEDFLTATLIAHEAMHAAAQLYFIDNIRTPQQRAHMHINSGNEVLAYLVGDLFGKVAQKVMDLGVTLNVGRPSFYGNDTAPPTLAASASEV